MVSIWNRDPIEKLRFRKAETKINEILCRAPHFVQLPDYKGTAISEEVARGRWFYAIRAAILVLLV